MDIADDTTNRAAGGELCSHYESTAIEQKKRGPWKGPCGDKDLHKMNVPTETILGSRHQDKVDETVYREVECVQVLSNAIEMPSSYGCVQVLSNAIELPSNCVQV